MSGRVRRLRCWEPTRRPDALPETPAPGFRLRPEFDGRGPATSDTATPGRRPHDPPQDLCRGPAERRVDPGISPRGEGRRRRLPAWPGLGRARRRVDGRLEGGFELRGVGPRDL